MARGRRDVFSTLRTEGGLLPADFLARLAQPGSKLEGLSPEAYHLTGGEKLNEAASRAWNRLLGVWAAFQAAWRDLRPGDPAVSLTREKWLLPLFQELGYGRLLPARTFEIEGKPYALSHLWQHTPIHLVGRGVDLDRRSPGVPGAARSSPHGLLQEFLSRSDGHLWGLVANGLKLRLLRDNKSFTRQAYVEFDVAVMMEGQVFSDFALLWLVCHQSRVEAERPELCWLEKWMNAAREQGTRALDQLRDGVQAAIEALGRGFLAHAGNRGLVERLRSGALDKQDYYRQVLRIVYRLIFVFVAEDRELLLTGDSTPEAHKARQRYERYYSTARLRRLAERRRGSPHGDLWRGLRLVFTKLSSAEGCPDLALPALGSFLWSAQAAPDLDACELPNADLLDAVRALAFRVEGRTRFDVDYRNLGPEELGSVYESLLELHPEINADAPRFTLKTAPGHERKTSGSYYTPTSLIECLLDSALDPVLAQAAREPDPEQAILHLKVCDPACGSGHFLIAAAHRIAKRLASVRTGDEEPSPEAVRTALRDVVGRCLYGVDVNPMALELCKVNLWLEALEPGKPLSFLEHHIQCGNSLLGATPALVAQGIPDEAFEPLEGDDKAVCRIFKKANRLEREGKQQSLLPALHAAPRALDDVSTALAQLDDVADDRIEGQQAKESRWRQIVASDAYTHSRLVADAWCAAFVWRKVNDPARPHGITEETLRRIERDPSSVPAWMRGEIARLRDEYQFLHWHVAFPTVFRVPRPDETSEGDQGWIGGFDVVLGNPPWDTLSPDVKEFFAPYNEQIRFTDKAGQDSIVAELTRDPEIAERWRLTRRHIYCAVGLIRTSGRYRLFAPGSLGKGDFNVYRIFVETALQIVRESGYLAQVVPAGFYGGANAMAIRREIFDRCSLELVIGLINTGERWFKGIDQTTRFAAYAASRGGQTTRVRVAFGVRSPDELREVLAGPPLLVEVAAVRAQSPKALAISETRGGRDAELAARMSARWPKFGDVSAGAPLRHYMRELDMGNDRERFCDQPPGLPVYEGRMVDQFDHRAKAYRSGRGRAAVWESLAWDRRDKAIIPQWYVPEDRLPRKVLARVRSYRIGFCDVTAPRNERTLLAALIPPGAVCGHKVPTISFPTPQEWQYLVWLAVANSFCIDFLARQRVTLAMSFTVVDSLPFPRLPIDHPLVQRVAPIALRLTCSGAEMTAYWNTMAQHGWCEPVSEGDTHGAALQPDVRRGMRAELDAIVAHNVFGLGRDDLAFILDTFPALQRREGRLFGEYRTKALVLAAYDVVAQQ